MRVLEINLASLPGLEQVVHEVDERELPRVLGVDFLYRKEKGRGGEGRQGKS